jgi:hypothetical protein
VDRGLHPRLLTFSTFSAVEFWLDPVLIEAQFILINYLHIMPYSCFSAATPKKIL